ncbi:hypothetical protein REPUB_Repub13aG0123400 [Reevesia pubescens]
MDAPPIRWKKGELLGSGRLGNVYMAMNLDSGELIAVKQVLIAANTSKEKTQPHIIEFEEEVKLLQNISHPNIVRYLGTTREDDLLNILYEFVPGGTISSLLGKFGSFPESVVRIYTKQLLLGLEYLHKNGIVHGDIKGENILLDKKGYIKLTDFGVFKKVVEFAAVNGAKSMKGAPYWMAPEVIRQMPHSFSSDIWSVGCTVIEMATGKPPWSQQYQGVAALFYIGNSKMRPPIPEHLSFEAKDFLLKCLQREPTLRPSASDLLQVNRERMFLLINLLLEVLLMAFSQCASPKKPQYSLIVLVVSVVAMFICIIELFDRGQKAKVVFKRRGLRSCFYHPSSSEKHFYSFLDIFVFICGISQYICSVVAYCYHRRHLESPIKVSFVSVMFIICMAFSKCSNNPNVV